MSRAEMRLARSTGSGDYRGASARQPLLAPDPDPEPPFSRYGRIPGDYALSGRSGYRGPRRGRSPRHPDTMTSLFTRGGPGWAEIKLCLWMGLCYFFMFTAYLSSQTLASTLPIPPPANGDDAMFIVYITFTFSSFWSPVLVHRVGAKPCIIMGFCMCTPPLPLPLPAPLRPPPHPGLSSLSTAGHVQTAPTSRPTSTRASGRCTPALRWSASPPPRSG